MPKSKGRTAWEIAKRLGMKTGPAGMYLSANCEPCGYTVRKCRPIPLYPLKAERKLKAARKAWELRRAATLINDQDLEAHNLCADNHPEGTWTH